MNTIAFIQHLLYFASISAGQLILTLCCQDTNPGTVSEPDGTGTNGDNILQVGETPEFFWNSATQLWGAYIGTIALLNTLGTLVTYPVFQLGNDVRVLNPGPEMIDVTNPLNNGIPLSSVVAENFCFAAGTRLATPQGWCQVEDLNVGDLVLTQSGRAVPVLFAGCQTIFPRFAPGPKSIIEIDAGAFGCGLPERSMRVTADHAFWIEGVLVTAGALVNGHNIRRATAQQLPVSMQVYSVETEAHELLIAEGVAAESFVDYLGRNAFDNLAEYQALYGTDGRLIREMDLPRITRSLHVPEAITASLLHEARRAA